MYSIVITPTARKALLKAPKKTAELIRDKLDKLKENPFAAHNDVKKLQGREGYRLRVGDWRILYHLNNQELQVIVIKVAPRGGVYQ